MPRDYFKCECEQWLRVSYGKQSGHNEMEEFRCPECSKEHKVFCSDIPFCVKSTKEEAEAYLAKGVAQWGP